MIGGADFNVRLFSIGSMFPRFSVTTLPFASVHVAPISSVTRRSVTQLRGPGFGQPGSTTKRGTRFCCPPAGCGLAAQMPASAASTTARVEPYREGFVFTSPRGLVFNGRRPSGFDRSGHDETGRGSDLSRIDAQLE